MKLKRSNSNFPKNNPLCYLHESEGVWYATASDDVLYQSTNKFDVIKVIKCIMLRDNSWRVRNKKDDWKTPAKLTNGLFSIDESIVNSVCEQVMPKSDTTTISIA